MNTTHPTSHVRLPRAVCAAVADILSGSGSHDTLNAVFEAAGAPGPPPDLPHSSKWKAWLFRAGNDPSVDSLAVLGNLIEEFMDLPPVKQSVSEIIDIGFDHDPVADWEARRAHLTQVLEAHGFRYFRGGRVLPVGQSTEFFLSLARSRHSRKVLCHRHWTLFS